MNRSRLILPEGVEKDEETYSTTFGRFTMQPLERGFGVTIGNSLRRVLLSSLHGAAITHVKIDGVVQEFSTLPGVVEDVSEILLNLKQVWLKILDTKPDKINLELKGPHVFTAKDIQDASSGIEILNPDHHIATMNEEANLVIELRVGRGRGYLTAEENKLPEQDVNTIQLDAVFNPIRKVNYEIDNVRVGDKTDYEKLSIEVTTNGSVTPDDALTYAGKILRDHIDQFISFEVQIDEEEDHGHIDEEALRIRKLLKLNVEELELSVRSHNCLKSAKIQTIGQLVKKTEQEMLNFKNFGRKSFQELSSILEEKGLHFGMDVDKYLKDDE